MAVSSNASTNRSYSVSPSNEEAPQRKTIDRAVDSLASAYFHLLKVEFRAKIAAVLRTPARCYDPASQRPIDAVCNTALEFAEALIFSIAKVDAVWRPPFVWASPDNEIIFEWIWNTDRLTVYVSEDGIEASILSSPSGALHFEDRVITSLDDVKGLIDWIVWQDGQSH